MGLNKEDTLNADSEKEKHMKSLRKSVQKTKCAIVDKLNKSEQRLKEEINTTEEDEKKAIVKKKLEKISRELNIIENLLEDDIVDFALTTHHKLMAVASNRRMPITMRMKARVASHKPLSSHLARIKLKLQKAKETETEEESEDEEETNTESTKPLDKMYLNNQIVQMRKDVKRAKVHIIHKLTRSINKLRSSKGKNKEKCIKKADRLVKKVQCLKIVNIDDISKFALTTTQDLKKLSTDVNSSLKTQVMATVAIHNCLSGTITDFKSKFPDWNKKVPLILKKKKKKRTLNNEMLKSEKENNNFSNNESKSTRINNSDIEQSVSDIDDYDIGDDDDDEGGSEVSGEDREESGSDEQIEDDTVQSSEHEVDEEDTLKVFRLKEKSVPNESVNDVGTESSDHEQPLKKIKKETSKTLTNLLKTKKSEIIDNKIPNSSKCVESPKKNKLKKVIKTVVDPFFVTSTNEEYVTSQVPSAVEDTNSNWSSRNKNNEYRETNKFYKNNKNWEENYNIRGKFSKGFDKPYQKSTYNNFNKGHEYSKLKTQTSLIFGNRKERRKALNQPIQEEKVEKLHPSWEAKKKLSNIASFQGKKIIFD